MSLRRTLGRVPFARNAWHLARELKNVVAYGAARARADFEQEFAGARDPWSFETDPVAGHHRFNRELALLEAVRGGRRFTRALEVGCAEGMFTQRLAPLCGELLAVDISPVALARARARGAWGSHVRFANWDLRADPVPGRFELVVVEGVLDCFCQPWALRAARDALVTALVPGGYLLAGNPRGTSIIEDAWWGRYLRRGGKWIDAYLAEHPCLSVESSARGRL